MSNKSLAASMACAVALWIAACETGETEKNPTFTTGDAGAPAGGQPTDSGSSGSSGSAGRSGEAGKPSVASGGEGGAPSAAAGAPTQPDPETAGAAGAAPEVPPYDCVLHPKTHLEIINACTTAVRIEKHPTLPALPP